MLRNNRNALWALGLAGAAYLWRNRAKLQQKANEWQSNRAPRQLPDYGTEGQQDQSSNGWSQPGQTRLSGSEL